MNRKACKVALKIIFISTNRHNIDFSFRKLTNIHYNMNGQARQNEKKYGIHIRQHQKDRELILMTDLHNMN